MVDNCLASGVGLKMPTGVKREGFKHDDPDRKLSQNCTKGLFWGSQGKCLNA